MKKTITLFEELGKSMMFRVMCQKRPYGRPFLNNKKSGLVVKVSACSKNHSLPLQFQQSHRVIMNVFNTHCFVLKKKLVPGVLFEALVLFVVTSLSLSSSAVFGVPIFVSVVHLRELSNVVPRHWHLMFLL